MLKSMDTAVTVEEILTTWRYITLEQWANAMDLNSIVVQVGFAKSKSEARRLHEQGAIRYAGAKTNDANSYVMFPPGDGPITMGTPHVVVSIDRSRLDD
jgi:tyrosyl-tRNA synthetase